jgi:alkyl hydroperoxide reductase subunit AhpC
LSANIDLEKFAGDLSKDNRTYRDTARIKFIVNKQGGVSDLSIKMTKMKKFADELTRVIKKSSCNWVAGGSDRPANGWHQFDIYYSVEEPSDNEVKTKMTMNEL